MARGERTRSSLLVFLMLTSVFVALVGPATPVVAANDTTSGTISGTEVWQGSHDLTGDVVVSSGAKLIIQPGTTVTFPNGTHLDARGSICIGASSCGASGNANTAQKITFRWTEPSNSSARGECYGMSNGNEEIFIEDPSCFEGVLIRDSIDLSQTAIRYLTIDGAWGIPYYIDTLNEFRYGALVLDGASPTLREMEFTDVNTSSVLTTNLAQPRFIGGEYVVGNDDESGVDGSAVQIYSSGTPVTPLIMDSPTLVGTDRGCGQRDGGRPTVWVQDAFIEIDDADISVGDFGISLRYSSGSVTNSSINVNCNGVDIYSLKSVGTSDYYNIVASNEITTGEGTPVTAYGGAHADIYDNELSGASGGSGIAVYSSYANIQDNDIGPIGGWNGLWMLGSFDVIAENNTIHDVAKEVVLAGEYGSNAPAPSAARAYLANNTLSTDGTGACSSMTHFDGEFTCPAVMAFRSGLTMYDNVINAAGDADGIRAVGALLDIRRNTWNVPSTGAVIKHFNTGNAGSQQYGTLGFFTENSWNGVDMTYNVTKSAVTVQSETIPSASAGGDPVILSWPDQEAWPANQFQNAIVPTEVQECALCDNLTPRNFPLAISMDNNSTVFTFAALANLDLSSIFIETQPTPYAVQVRRAELVRYQVLVEGERVAGAGVLVEDALGNDLYDIETLDDGYTPWFSLPSDFHLDFRGLGGGDNPDGYANDEFEDSCTDGIDNDGDLVTDTDDPDCDYAAGTRELSLYRYTAYKFGSGLDRGEFTLEDSSYQGTAELLNLAPSVSVSQNEGHSFRKIVNITGNAHDGVLAAFYQTDELAQWDQKGYVHSVEVKDPFTGDWDNALVATDSSGAGMGEVTRNNHPFKTWFYELDMSSMAEGDYTFEFRSFDGITHSPIVGITIKLNTQAPTISVTSPSSMSTHSDDSVTFEGTAYDFYGCPEQCSMDVEDIYFQIVGPNFQVITPVSGGPDWSWTWDFGGQPRVNAQYTFTIWASDSDFCVGVIDECEATVLTLNIDNSNTAPFLSVTSPQNGDRLAVSETSVFEGVARDSDGTITRVDVEVLDIANGYINVHSDAITDFASNGAFSQEWNSMALRHNAEYQIRMRSYDGFDYSEWIEFQITADNPPDAGNNQPVFDSSDWVDEITLYCELDSQSQDRCTLAEIDLMQYFSDADQNQELMLSVYDNEELTSDDEYGVVFSIASNGEATYNPITMSFYDPEISGWSLDGVIFVASDPFGSKANSLPVSINVIGLSFVVNEPEDSRIGDDEIAIFTGTGLPGKTVTATIGGNPVNNTVISSDSTWQMGIPGSRISGSATPQFKYGGETYEPGFKITVSDDEGTGIGVMLILGVVILLGAIAAFAYFFVEIEEEDEAEDSTQVVDSEEREEDPYSRAKSEEEAPSTQNERFQSHADHPGWLWDTVDQEWVPEDSQA